MRMMFPPWLAGIGPEERIFPSRWRAKAPLKGSPRPLSVAKDVFLSMSGSDGISGPGRRLSFVRRLT